MRLRILQLLLCCSVCIGLTSCGEEEVAGGSDSASKVSYGAYESPLEKAIGGLDAEVTRQLKVTAQQEQAAGDCMRSRGWTYQPQVKTREQVAKDLATTQLDDALHGTVTDQGYGVLAAVDENGQFVSREGLDESADPLAGLSEAQQDAYMTDVSGDTSKPAGEPGGCGDMGVKATAERYPAYFEILKFRDGLTIKVGDNPTYRKAVGDWQACLSDAGYRYTSQNDVIGDLEQKMRELQEAQPIDKAAPTQLRDYERQVAKADHDCRTKTIVPALAKIKVPLETEFVEQHREAIDKMAKEGP